jgi:hypothetical protein
MGTLIFLLILGAITAAIAATKGRSIVGWFFVGFLLGLIGLIIVLCMSNLEEERARQARMDTEQRRLRERLRQEQLKNEAFRQHAARRLDVHDRQLGVDTRPPGPSALAGGGNHGTALPSPQRTAVMPPDEDAFAQEDGESTNASHWYYEINGQTYGPEARRRIVELLQAGEISRHTLLCAEGDQTWQPLHLFPAFRDARRST